MGSGFPVMTGVGVVAGFIIRMMGVAVVVGPGIVVALCFSISGIFGISGIFSVLLFMGVIAFFRRLLAYQYPLFTDNQDRFFFGDDSLLVYSGYRFVLRQGFFFS